MIRGTGDHLHHILPVNCGGSYTPSNLVMLTHKEHRIAHLLLSKINKSYKDRSAYSLLGGKIKTQKSKMSQKERCLQHYYAKAAYYKSIGLNTNGTIPKFGRGKEEKKRGKYKQRNKKALSAAERVRAYRLRKKYGDEVKGLSSREILNKYPSNKR